MSSGLKSIVSENKSSYTRCLPVRQLKSILQKAQYRQVINPIYIVNTQALVYFIVVYLILLKFMRLRICCKNV